ncbi:MAG: hypothetical protein ACRDU5_19700 [Mycobacterium sp.]
MASLLHLRRIVPAALLAATAVLGGSAVGDTATACAAPNTGGREWDVKAYDTCMRDILVNRDPNKSFRDEHKRCCSESGGDWDASTNNCVAPAAAPAPAEPTLPGVAPRPGVATQPPRPPPDPGPAAPPPNVIGPG